MVGLATVLWIDACIGVDSVKEKVLSPGYNP